MAKLPSRRMKVQRGLALAAAVAAGVFAPKVAEAHFVLVAPDNWMSQDPNTGAPLKTGPCGNEPGGTATNAVTAFQEGDMIMVTIHEVITHPGHYRVALSVNGQAGLPPEPTAAPCTDVVVQDPPVFPVLADGLLQHTTAFAGPQTMMIKLPEGTTCTSNCVLQVLEIMTDKPSGCFYHHCANITISATGGTTATTAATTVTASSAGTGGAGAGGAGGAPAGAGGTGTASASEASSGPVTSSGAVSSSVGLGSDAVAGSVGPSSSSAQSSTTGAQTSTGAHTASSTQSTSNGAGGANGSGGAGSSLAGPESSSGGCGCSVPTRQSPALPALAALLGLASLVRRRRRG